MTINKKMITVIAILTILLLCIYLAFLIYEKVTYEKYAGKNIYSNKNDEIILTYQNNDINISFYDTSSLVTQLQYRDRELYFSDIKSFKKDSILLTSHKITITISPKDEKSIFLEFDMERGLDRKYVLNDLSFNELLDILYKITGNDIFIVTEK